MQCPSCRLESPPSASACDCGYLFATGGFAPKRLSSKPSSEAYRDPVPRIAAWFYGTGALDCLIGLFLFITAFAIKETLPQELRIIAGSATFSSGMLFIGIGFALHRLDQIAHNTRRISL
jgi:hypothetical protein